MTNELHLSFDHVIDMILTAGQESKVEVSPSRFIVRSRMLM